jgi:hypothetical protein
MSFKITKLDKLSEGVKRTTSYYDEIISQLTEKGVGCYEVAVEKNKPVTVYQQLYKHTKGRPEFKIHKITDKVYVEVIAEKKPKTK